MIDAPLIDKVFQPIANLLSPASPFRLAQFFVDGAGLLMLLHDAIRFQQNLGVSDTNDRTMFLGLSGLNVIGTLFVWSMSRRSIGRIERSTTQGLNPFRFALLPMRLGLITFNALDWWSFMIFRDAAHALYTGAWLSLLVAVYFASCNQAPPLFMFRKKMA